METVAGALGLSRDQVSLTLGIGDVAEWNSIGNLNLIAALERRFGVEIPLDDLFEMTSVQGIVDEIKKLVHGPDRP